MKKILNFLLGIGAYLVCVFLLTGYGHTETHPALNDVMVLKFLDKLVNKDFADQEKFRNYEFNWNNDKQPSLTGPAITGDFYLSYSAADEKQMSYTPMKWISEGGWMEDEPWGPASLCHFYDPVGIDNGKKHLTDRSGYIEREMEPVLSYMSRDALSWAVSDPSHAYGWKIGKEHVIQALKEPDPVARNNHMAIAYRCLGQVLHLVADMGCSPHVRNDSHPPKFTIIIGDPDPYEDICKKLDVYTLWQANPANPSLKAAFKSEEKFEVLFDNLARFTNRSYFSGQTIYTDRYNPVVRPGNPYPAPYMTEDHYNKTEYAYYADYAGVKVKMCKDKVPIAFPLRLIFGNDSTRGRPYLDYDCVYSIASAVYPNISEAGANVIRMFVPPLKMEITEAKADSGGIIRGKVSYWVRSLNDEYSTLFDLGNVYNGAVGISVNNKDEKIKTDAVKNKFEFKLDGKLAKLKKEDKITVLIDFGGILVKSDPFSLSLSVPTISGTSPVRGNTGQEITIDGSNFGTDRSKGEIHFTGAVASSDEITGWSAGQIRVKVPYAAVTGPLKIKVNDVFSNEVAFGVPPIISFMSDTAGAIGDWITIFGEKFGSLISEGSVEFNGAPASEFETWDNVTIRVRVPVTASSGPVVVKVKGEVSNPKSFRILGPQITSIEPAMRKVGELVTIFGTSFGSDRSKGEVLFNSVKADDIISWDKTAITVRIPADAETGNVVVRVGGVLSNQYYYTVKSIVPEITGISPEKQRAGQWITITGANFGYDKTVGNIELNGRIIPGTSASRWTDLEISLTLPPDASSGFLYVIVNGLRSNAVYFKVSILYYQRIGISTNHTYAKEAEGYKSTSVFGENFAEFSQEWLNPDNNTNGKNTVRGTWEIPPEKFYLTDTVNLKITASLVSREGNLPYKCITAVRLENHEWSGVYVTNNGDQKLYSEGNARFVEQSFWFTSRFRSPIVISVHVETGKTFMGKAITSYSYELREE